MFWLQQQISVGPFPRGFHLITSQISQVLDSGPHLDLGICHVFILHTSASLTINENADPDVRVDLESSMNAIAPESFPYIHTLEGPDDMPAHVKCSLLGSSITVPLRNQRLVLGTWQGIYLCEHRDHASRRQLVITAYGDSKSSRPDAAF
jgi:secondary thiamine-phosphate synthase enzyme